jgi:hypothetical protein
MLPDLTDTDGWNNFAAASTPGDLAMAAAILLAAEAKKKSDPSGYFAAFNRSSPVNNDTEKMAVELANKAAAQPGDGSLVSDMLEGLGLID